MTFFDTLVIIGICFILKYGSILNFIRTPLQKTPFLKELFSCSLCLGFHIGFWTAIFSGILSIGYVMESAFYSSAMCWLADHFIMVAQKYLYGETDDID